MEGKNIHEQHLKQDSKETKELWTAFNGEKTLEPKIEEFLLWLSSYPFCIKETNHQIVENLHAMTKEEI